MADKSVGELIAAESVTPTDLFVLEQNGTAKKLTGQILENWLVSFADGHGGIQSYELLETVGLVKTYRFTLADQTYMDIDVVDGRGIKSLKPTATNGLKVTYTVTYNDDTTDTFTVTNGAKGDKGDNANIWVKYASQKPTEASHSFGDIPDAWIGVSSGHLTEAPTNWQQYTWYQWKGEKGDTGEPATIVSAEITYHTSGSGTIIPSGSWGASVPPVTPGRYLWTRQVLQFNTGAPITSYSVSRFGIDGTGAVSSVAGVAPDETGNVPLDASSVKALALSGGTMEGPINMNGQKLYGLNAPTADDEAATKGFVSSEIQKIDVSSQISGKVDKSSVVNNFTTTKKGFVADARALKTLNDSKLSMELLWENDSPTSEISGVIQLDLNGYNFVDVECRITTTTNYNIMNRIAVGTAALFSSDDNNGKNITRVIRATGNSVDFSKGYIYNTYGSYAEDNSVIIPTRIYGVKGGL